MFDKKTKKHQAPAPRPINGSTASPLEQAVKAREEQAQLADRLAGVDVAHLQQAETDPALLEHADTERQTVHALELTREREVRELAINRSYERQRREVEDESTWATAQQERTRRQVTRGIADADHAARDVDAIEGALDETRPATAATKLARAQEKVVCAFLGFGAAGSLLSAIGIANALHSGTTAAWSGAIATAAIVEIPSTLLASFVIWTQGFLNRMTRANVQVQEEDGTTVRMDPMAALPNWVRPLAWRVVAGLLAFSVLINLWGAAVVGVGMWGVIGAVGAVIAAASSLLGWAFSLQASAVISANMDSPGVSDSLEERRRVASGADIPWQDTTQDGGRPAGGDLIDGQVLEALLAHEDTRRRVVDVIADMETALGPVPDDASDLTPPAAPEVDGPTRSELRELPYESAEPENGSTASDQHEHPAEAEEAAEDGPTVSDQEEHDDTEEVPPTAEATRAVTERAETRRAQALALWEQGWCAGEIADQVNQTKRTIRSYLAEHGVHRADLEQRNRDRVKAYIDHEGPQITTRRLAEDLHLTRTEAKTARTQLAEDGVEAFPADQ